MSNESKILEHINNIMNLTMYCSECGSKNSKENNYCLNCGHKLKSISENDELYRKYCVFCGEQLKKDDDYCRYCGNSVSYETRKIKICSVCGEWCDDERYCWNCGHDNSKNVHILKLLSEKKCPNCNSYYDGCYSYCDDCGTKLIKK